MKYVFAFDTATKDLTVTKDGLNVPNVTSVSVSKYSYGDDEDNYVSIQQETKNDDGSKTRVYESTEAAVIESISSAMMGTVKSEKE